MAYARRAFLSALATLFPSLAFAQKRATTASIYTFATGGTRGELLTAATAGTKAAPGAKLRTWRIAWGDGQIASGAGAPPGYPTHAYAASGDYTVRFDVTDSRGGSAFATMTAYIRITNVDNPDNEDTTAYGPRVESRPSGSVLISTSDNIQTVINANDAGTTYWLATGTHRITSALTLKTGDTLFGEYGATLSGGRDISPPESTWTFDGTNYWVGGQTQGGSTGGACFSGFNRCIYPEDVFFDGSPLIHAQSIAEMAVGKYFFDYATDRIYIRSNPTGHTVETSVTSHAINATNNNITLRNLIVEKFACPAQTGAIRANDRSGWTIYRCRVQWNHGIGVRIGPAITIQFCQLNDNGQMGVGGTGSGSLMEDTEIARSNYAEHNYFWEAAGTKFTFSNGFTIRRCWVHHNNGSGLWADIDNQNFVFEDNIVEDNANNGLFYELGFGGIIRNNIVRRNGTDQQFTFWVEGSNIVVSNSRNVEVYGNTVTDGWNNISLVESNRGFSTIGLGEWTTQGCSVHDNVVTNTTHPGTGAGRTGGIDQTGTNRLYNGTNTWANNAYTYPNNGVKYHFWQGEKTDVEWEAFSMISGESFTRV